MDTTVSARLVARYLKLAGKRPNYMDPSTRTRINRSLDKVISGREHYIKPEHGYSAAIEVLRAFGIELFDLADSWEFTRPEGRFSLRIAFKTADPFSPLEIQNAVLVLAFHRRKEDDYEVTGYVS